MIILNYSHPLSPIATRQPTECIGAFDEVVIPVQLNMDQPIQPQMEALVEAGLDVLIEDDGFLIIPPALSFAAAYVASRLKEELASLANREALPMVILKAVGTPPPISPGRNPMTTLTLFDLDETLAHRDTGDLLPGVLRHFTLTPPARWCIVTNQGGVGLRRWMERHGFGEPDRYPTAADIDATLGKVVDAIGKLPLNVYVCYAYQARSGDWAPTPPEGEGDPSWSPGWRKPSPGMLLQACLDAGVSPADALMVGDHRYTILTKWFKLPEIPVVVIDKPIQDRMASTIRHNRARGKHQVDMMSVLVEKLLKLGWADIDIANHLGMEAEEVLRLKQMTGLAGLFAEQPYSRSWERLEGAELEDEITEEEIENA